MTTKPPASFDHLGSQPLDYLDYFVEWGTPQWQHLIDWSFTEFLGKDLTNLKVLDIGTRYGKMACLFALLGAKVTGVDIHLDYLQSARLEAQRLKVQDSTCFLQYDGYLSIFGSEMFDIVFTKSVLVLVNELDAYLQDIRRILKPEGKFVFVENGYGNVLLHKMRALRHRSWSYQDARYFTKREFYLVRQIFPSVMTRRVYVPPIWMMYGKKTA